MNNDSSGGSVALRSRTGMAAEMPRPTHPYIWTLEGWVCLAVTLDLYSRRVVGWAMRKSLNRELAIAALHQASVRRHLDAGLMGFTRRACDGQPLHRAHPREGFVGCFIGCAS